MRDSFYFLFQRNLYMFHSYSQQVLADMKTIRWSWRFFCSVYKFSYLLECNIFIYFFFFALDKSPSFQRSLR